MQTRYLLKLIAHGASKDLAQSMTNVCRRLPHRGFAILASILLLLSTTDAFAAIEGYLSAFSAVQGGDVKLYISADTTSVDAQVFRIDVPDQPVLSLAGLQTIKFSTSSQAWTDGARWSNPITLAIPSEWPSGLYRVSLSTIGTQAIPIYFVVREDRPGSQSKILVLDNATTSVAYNNWGGKSTYTFNSTDKVFAPSVSLLRPGNHTALPQELEFARWARAMKIPLEYASMLDLQADPGLLTNYSVVVFVGHSEYWSKEMRDHFETFLLNGGNAMILGGNTMWWQVRIEGDQLVCYKFAKDNLVPLAKGDPLNGVDNSRVTVNWYGTPVLRPEDTVTGLSWRHGGYVNAFGFYPASEGWGGYTVVAADHWLFQSTGLHDGDVFGREHKIVGYETDGALFQLINGKPVVTGVGGTPLNFEILASAPAKTNGGHPGSAATLGIYQTVGGGYVFNAATVSWADGLWSLATAEIADRQVSAITYNAFAVLAKLSPLLPAAPTSLDVPSPSSVTEAFTVSWRKSVGYKLDYELEQATHADFADAANIYRGSDTSARVNPVENGTYFYRVRACNSSGCSGATAAPSSVVVAISKTTDVDTTDGVASTRKARKGGAMDAVLMILIGVYAYRRYSPRTVNCARSLIVALL